MGIISKHSEIYAIFNTGSEFIGFSVAPEIDYPGGDAWVLSDKQTKKLRKSAHLDSSVLFTASIAKPENGYPVLIDSDKRYQVYPNNPVTIN